MESHRSDKGKQPVRTTPLPELQPKPPYLPAALPKLLAAHSLPPCPRFITLTPMKEILDFWDHYPVAIEALAYKQLPMNTALVISHMADKIAKKDAAFTKQIESVQGALVRSNKRVADLENKLLDQTEPTIHNMIANAAQEATTSTLQNQVETLRNDLSQLLYERNTLGKENEEFRNERGALLSDLGNHRTSINARMDKKEEEINMLRTQVSRLMTKNVREALEFNDLVDDYQSLLNQLQRARERIVALEDIHTSNYQADDESVDEYGRRRSTRRPKGKGKKPAKQQELSDPVAQAIKTAQEAADQRDEEAGEKRKELRLLKESHLKLKRKYDQITDDPPVTTMTIGDTATVVSDMPPKKRKTKASKSVATTTRKDTVAESPSKLYIDLKVFCLPIEGTISRHCHMHALESKVFPSTDLDALMTVSWNFLSTSHTDAQICGNATTDDFYFFARARSFPNGRWETIDQAGVKLWWAAAKGAAEMSEQGLLGQVDVMFAAKELHGSEWMVERSIRLADTSGNGDSDGFAVVEKAG